MGPAEMAQQVNMLAAKPEFDTQDPHDGRKELTPKSCPKTSALAPWHTQPFPLNKQINEY